jgi:hypothetical protein
MKLSLFILGAFATIVCIEKPAEAQSGGWCAYLDGGGHDGSRECGFATLQQCLATVRGVGGNCSPSPYYEPPRYPRYRWGYPY